MVFLPTKQCWTSVLVVVIFLNPHTFFYHPPPFPPPLLIYRSTFPLFRSMENLFSFSKINPIIFSLLLKRLTLLILCVLDLRVPSNASKLLCILESFTIGKESFHIVLFRSTNF